MTHATYSKGKLAKPALVQPNSSLSVSLSTSSSLPLSSQAAYKYRMCFNSRGIYILLIFHIRGFCIFKFADTIVIVLCISTDV